MHPSGPQILVSLAVLVATFSTGALLWKLGGRIEGRGRRRSLRVTAVLVALGSLVLVATMITRTTRHEGRWLCLLCGACEERIAYFGIVVDRGPTSRYLDLYEEARAFTSWYEREIGAEHEHVWRAAGCHGYGTRSVGCTGFYADPPWFLSLPRIRDREIVEHLFAKVRDASPVDHRVMLDRNLERSELFQQLAGGLRLPPAEERRRFDAWLAENPLWQ